MPVSFVDMQVVVVVALTNILIAIWSWKLPLRDNCGSGASHPDAVAVDGVVRRTGPGPRCKIAINYSVVGDCGSIARRAGRGSVVGIKVGKEVMSIKGCDVSVELFSMLAYNRCIGQICGLSTKHYSLSLDIP